MTRPPMLVFLATLVLMSAAPAQSPGSERTAAAAVEEASLLLPDPKNPVTSVSGHVTSIRYNRDGFATGFDLHPENGSIAIEVPPALQTQAVTDVIEAGREPGGSVTAVIDGNKNLVSITSP